MNKQVQQAIFRWQLDWKIARGIPDPLWGTWGKRGLSRSVPMTCQICDEPWRPDKETYVAIFGDVIKTVFGHKWFCKELGLVRNTGWLEPHIRYVCRDCGQWPGTAVVDHITGETVILRPRMTGPRGFWRKLWTDTQYWTLAYIRFAQLSVQKALYPSRCYQEMTPFKKCAHETLH